MVVLMSGFLGGRRNGWSIDADKWTTENPNKLPLLALIADQTQ